MIPMIDVFFIISTLSITINRGLPVHLPTADTAQKEVREHINRTVMSDGTMCLKKQPITLPDMGQRVNAALVSDPQRTVVVNTDGQVWHSTVVDILDERRLAGVSGLAMAVTSGKKSSG
jgi:biopolymer transport protein ExbD